jgi:hypothetical protein
MIPESDEELSTELRQKLRAFAHGTEPPAWLEDRVVAALQQQGLLRPERPPRTVRVQWLAMATACAVLFAAGFLLGKAQHPAPAEPAGDRFVLFVDRLSDAFESDPKQEAQLVHEYAEWARKERAAGHLLVGEKLDDEAVELSGPTEAGKAPASTQAVSGYFVIVAQNLDGAIRIARTCPHLQHGGRIVIRPIDRVP